VPSSLPEVSVPKFNLDLSDQAAAVLDDLASQQGTTKADILRQALSLQKWFNETQKKGSKIVVESDGVQREVLPLK
jgi:hypothetical protein